MDVTAHSIVDVVVVTVSLVGLNVKVLVSIMILVNEPK